MGSNNITHAINGAVFEIKRSLFLASLRRYVIKEEIKMMVLDLPEGHHG